MLSPTVSTACTSAMAGSVNMTSLVTAVPMVELPAGSENFTPGIWARKNSQHRYRPSTAGTCDCRLCAGQADRATRTHARVQQAATRIQNPTAGASVKGALLQLQRGIRRLVAAPLGIADRKRRSQVGDRRRRVGGNRQLSAAAVIAAQDEFELHSGSTQGEAVSDP